MTDYKRMIVQVHKDVTTDEIHKALYDGNVGYCAKDSDWLYEVKEEHETANGKKRMTTKQRDRLWEMCGRYNVPFREDDYYIDAATGMVEGWIGGSRDRNYRLDSGNEWRKTIYVGVEPDGRSHT